MALNLNGSYLILERIIYIMKIVVLVLFALVLAVFSSPEEQVAEGETYTQMYPFAQRAFFYYPAGAASYLSRLTPPSSVDFVNSPYDAAAAPVAPVQDMMRPAAYFVPASDLLSMPYPAKADQEVDEKAAMKHLEMLKELHDHLEKTEQRFLVPSISMAGNAVTLSTNAFVSMLNKLSKTVTKVVTTTVFVTSENPTTTETLTTTDILTNTTTIIDTTTVDVITTTTTTLEPITTVTTITSTILP